MRSRFATAPRRLRPTSAKMMAAIAGGEYCFHHSGPYTHPRYAKRRHHNPSKRKLWTSRAPAVAERFTRSVSLLLARRLGGGPGPPPGPGAPLVLRPGPAADDGPQ